jgi:hypothetical protein
MRGLLACGAFAAAALMGGAAAAAPSVQIKDAVARVTVIPEDRADVKVEFLTRNPALPLVVTKVGDRTVIDGDLRHNRIHNCMSLNGRTAVGVRGVGKVDWKDMPQVVVRTPREARVAANGAVFGSIGRSSSLDFANAGCGDWTIANVDGLMELREAGSGDVRAGAAGSAKVDVAGSGDVHMSRIGGDLTVNIAGSGDVRAASITGDLNARVAGSGDVQVEGGQARIVKASIAGSGDVAFGGTAQELDARVMGSGDVVAARVVGPVRKSVMGSGDVRAGD